MTSRTFEHFRTERQSGVVTVWIDVADRSMNVFSDRVIAELELVVADLEHICRTHTPDAIVFRSAKPSGFFAGADVHQIAELRNRDEVETVIRRGQRLFDRVERLTVPTIAAIHGPCLGGGLEFALACSHRVAMSSASTRLGLPEVQLGLIPGWGGTQRLPRTVGLMESLPLILKGKKLSAEDARHIGLVDAVSSKDGWDSFLKSFVDDVGHVRANGELRPGTRPSVSLSQRITRMLTESRMGRWFVMRSARVQVARDAANYPALNAALRAVAAAFDEQENGYDVECREFSELIGTQTCRNLLNLFLNRERARAYRVENERPTDIADDSTKANEIRCVGIIGAGAMGAGIGQLAALKGYAVVLKELNTELAEAGLARVRKLIDDMVRKKRLTTADAAAVMDRVSATADYADLADCDLVIEAVVEKMDVKQGVFSALDRVLRPHALIASNTSALSVTEMAQATSRTNRVAGLHFFNPVHRMDLVEVVRSRDCSDETINTLLRFAKKLGKTPIVTADSPGFLVNRVLFPYIGEAIRMVMEGHDVQAIDRELKRFGMPMGPIELVDHVGVDVAWHVASTLEDVLPDSADVIRMLGQMVARDMTGAKGGRGFYEYGDGKVICPADLSAVSCGGTWPPPKHADETTEPRRRSEADERFIHDGLTDVQRRLVYPLINEAGFCMQDGVVAELWMADLAMVLGTGFAPFRGGPIALADAIGREVLLNNLHVLTVRYGDRFKPSAWLAERNRASQGRSFQKNLTETPLVSKEAPATAAGFSAASHG